jgi:hypothetical protein
MSKATEVNQVVAEAIALVVSQVPAEMRKQVEAVLTNVAVAQYQAGYSAATKSALELVGAL